MRKRSSGIGTDTEDRQHDMKPFKCPVCRQMKTSKVFVPQSGGPELCLDCYNTLMLGFDGWSKWLTRLATRVAKEQKKREAARLKATKAPRSRKAKAA